MQYLFESKVFCKFWGPRVRVIDYRLLFYGTFAKSIPDRLTAVIVDYYIKSNNILPFVTTHSNAQILYAHLHLFHVRLYPLSTVILIWWLIFWLFEIKTYFYAQNFCFYLHFFHRNIEKKFMAEKCVKQQVCNSCP